MSWKLIEIICIVFAAVALLPAAFPQAVSQPVTRESAPKGASAQAFSVYTEPDRTPRRLAPLPGVREGTSPTNSAHIPDIPYTYFWTPRDGLRWRAYQYAQRQSISEHSPGLLGGFPQPRLETPATRWQPRPSYGGWSTGAARWNAELDRGAEFVLGNREIITPGWQESVRLSGISLSQSFMAGSDDVSQWNYSFALGAVDQSASGANDLEFGPTAGSLMVSYDYNPRLRIETRTEVATDLLMSGIAGQYDLGPFGRWRSGIARSNQGMHQGWRYRAMADFDLAPQMSVGWVGERQTDGFMDIRRYAAGSSGIGGERQRWSASWDVGRWGKWSGSFETVHGRSGTQQRRFGLSQQFWYTPKLRIGIHAEREAVAGDYDIGLRFSFPLY